MKFFQLVLLCFICVAKSYSQTVSKTYGRIDVAIIKEKKPKRIYTKVEITRAFPGGDSSWMQSLESKLNQSIRVDRRVKKGTHVVSVQFIVDKEGGLTDVKSLTTVGFGLEAQVISAIQKKTKWGPGPAPVRPYSDQQ